MIASFSLERDNISNSDNKSSYFKYFNRQMLAILKG